MVIFNPLDQFQIFKTRGILHEPYDPTERNVIKSKRNKKLLIFCDLQVQRVYQVRVLRALKSSCNI